MNKLFRLITVLALAFTFSAIKAQEVSPVDFMRLNPYQMNANPATDLPYESVMSFFVGNFDLSLNNTSIRYDNIFDFDAQGRPAMINLRKFADAIKENNYLGISMNESLFTLYRSINDNMLTFDYRLKVKSDMTYDNGLFKLLSYGNSAFVGESNPINIDLNMNTQVYQEISVGYQWNVLDNLSVGGRAKLLFGVANVTTDAFNVKLYTDPDSYALRLMEDVSMSASLPSVFTLQDGVIGTQGRFKVADLFRNPGFGLDFAAEYHFNEKFSAVAAVHDMGFISWSGNNMKMVGEIVDGGQFYDDGSFLFSGLEMEQLQLVISDASYRTLFLDSLKQYFQLQFTPQERYTTMLNTNILLRGNYDITPHSRISAQMRGYFMGSGFRPAMTLAYSGSFFRMLDICATYTMMRGSYANIGFGLAGNFGIFQIYATTNNVLGFFDPTNGQTLNAQVGVVFNLFKKDRDSFYE